MASRESDRQQVSRGWLWRVASILAVVSSIACLGGVTGCVALDGFISVTDEAPTGVPCQVMATWNREVLFVPDPAHMGQPGPGIAGRVYLFGEKVGYPMAAEGNLVVDLYNDAAPAPQGSMPVPLEEWRIDKDTLKRLLRKDPIGWGYTVFLPWGTYRPDITRVHMRVRFDPVKGTPLYGEGSPLTLQHADK